MSRPGSEGDPANPLTIRRSEVRAYLLISYQNVLPAPNSSRLALTACPGVPSCASGLISTSDPNVSVASTGSTNIGALPCETRCVRPWLNCIPVFLALAAAVTRMSLDAFNGFPSSEVSHTTQNSLLIDARTQPRS